MKDIRRKEKKIDSIDEINDILQKTKFVTIAMCKENIPYIVTLTHGYDRRNNCIYFHCAKEGKKIDYLKENNLVWGQALIDYGYVSGKCDHLYATVHFQGNVFFISDIEEKRHALKIMIDQQESSPEQVISEQITKKSLKKVHIGRIDFFYLSGKKSDTVIIS